MRSRCAAFGRGFAEGAAVRARRHFCDHGWFGKRPGEEEEEEEAEEEEEHEE